MTLLPEDRHLGWTPYAWLVYFIFFAVAPFVTGAPGRTQVLTLVAIVAILPVYFWAHWLNGPRVLWAIAICVAFGTFFARINPAGSVFIIYGACFLGQAGEPAVGFRWLGVLLAVVGLESWVLKA